jgi:hypothetical protein
MGEILSYPPRRAVRNSPSIAHGMETPEATAGKLLADHPLRPATASATLACQSRRRPPCRSHPPRRHAGTCGPSHFPSCRAVGAAAPASTYRGNGERVSWTRTAVRRVFHIVSTGEPALAVQAGVLCRGPRHRTAGARGLRFPEEQGTGLRRVIHSVSRAGVSKRPAWPLAVHRFSPGHGSSWTVLDPARASGRPRRRRGQPRSERTAPLFIHRLRCRELTRSET